MYVCMLCKLQPLLGFDLTSTIHNNNFPSCLLPHTRLVLTSCMYVTYSWLVSELGLTWLLNFT